MSRQYTKMEAIKEEVFRRKQNGETNRDKQTVAEYVHFYNFQRIHLKNGLIPFEIWSKTA